MMLNKKGNIQTFLGCTACYENSDIVIFGAPFDSTTTNRPGARFAPAAMRMESYGLETYSPYLERDLEDISVYDAGDLELPVGNAQSTLNMIQNVTKDILDNSKFPLMIGGEHLVTLGAIREFSRQYPDLRIIHFDAHADLRDDFLGEKLSHSTVIRRCWELLGDNKIFQFGIRSGEKSEFEWAKEHVFMNKFNFDGLEKVIESLRNYPVYFTLDLDVLDSGVFWGTGTPEAGGVSFMQLLSAIKQLSVLNLVGADIVELAPNLDTSGVSTATACKVLRELILSISI
ncbi:MAG: agmatinase [Defluviitaleaceae bacterium]|nr:agmatinase [Defluviitaleaceae bacterium]